MKQTIQARTLDSGLIEPHHEIEVVCSACGYDLDEAQLQDADGNVMADAKDYVRTLP